MKWSETMCSHIGEFFWLLYMWIDGLAHFNVQEHLCSRFVGRKCDIKGSDTCGSQMGLQVITVSVIKLNRSSVILVIKYNSLCDQSCLGFINLPLYIMSSSKWSESESCSVVSDSLWPHRLYSPWHSPGQNTEEGSFSLLQGIFPAQGSNPDPPSLQSDSLPVEPPRASTKPGA